MKIQTTRFGELEIDEQRIVSFSKGLLGFPTAQKYVLLEAGEDTSFWWLQSTEDADLAFVVTDPNLFVPNYQVPIKQEQLQDMGIETIESAQVFVIVNKRGQTLTGNLQGPLIINVPGRTGEQLVISDRRYNTRVPLIDLDAGETKESERHAASA